MREEESATLLTRLRLARLGQLPPLLATQTKERLREGYLPLISTLAKQYAREHVPFHMLEGDDLLQEASLALRHVLEEDPLSERTIFGPYAIRVRGSRFGRACGADHPMAVPASTWHHHKEQGTLDQVRRGFIRSLDAPLYEQDRHQVTLAARLAAPPLMASALTVLSNGVPE